MKKVSRFGWAIAGAFLACSCAPDFKDKASELKGLRVMAVKKDSPYVAPGQTVKLTMLWHDGSDKGPRQIQIAWIAACYDPASDLYSLCFTDHSLDGLPITSSALPLTAGDAASLVGDAGASDAAVLAASSVPAPSPVADGAVIVDASAGAGGPTGAGAVDAGTVDASTVDASTVDASTGDIGPLPGSPRLSIPFSNQVFGSGDFPATLGYGESFSFRMPSKIISVRPAPQDPRIPSYGIAYVFFALCAGEVRIEPDAAFPLACYDGSQRMGSDDFVAGYSAVYSYSDPAVNNSNPQIEPKLLINDKNAAFDCIGESCSGLIPPSSTAAGHCSAANTLPLCQDEKHCPHVKIKPLIDQSRPAEEDQVFNISHSEQFGEQMWVNYYADRGKFGKDLRLVNDAVAGWSNEYEAEYVPTARGTAYLWAVVHDNRGGVEWMRTSLCIK
jgi:hypothetical protein